MILPVCCKLQCRDAVGCFPCIVHAYLRNPLVVYRTLKLDQFEFPTIQRSAMFWPMQSRPVRRFWSTAFPTSLASGAAPTTTAPWPPSATIMPMICPSRSMTLPWSWNCSTSTILLMKCCSLFRVASIVASLTA